MRVIPAVEEDEMPCLGPERRAGAFDPCGAISGSIVGENQLSARTRRMIGAKEKPGQRVRIDVTLETHFRSALHVQDSAVAVILRGGDLFSAINALGQLPEAGPIQPIQPRQAMFDAFA